ncbi:hypothetical protein A3860_35095 [Niastella vici]|uniref:Uncharacterized protein n=1 Tax=Niastella vici TaxID=1703345 RepID=A0A1V9FP01_9BACT|nr:hypothetical protein A3860_35095 [Niastella vici]
MILTIYLYQKARQQFRTDEYKIPHHRQYLLVSRNFKSKIAMKFEFLSNDYFINLIEIHQLKNIINTI